MFRENCLIDPRPVLAEGLPANSEYAVVNTSDIGYHFKFKNGLKLSVQGRGYTSGHQWECAVFDQHHKIIPLSDNDDVRGWVGESELIELAKQVMTDTIPTYKGFSWDDEDDNEE